MKYQSDMQYFTRLCSNTFGYFSFSLIVTALISVTLSAQSLERRDHLTGNENDLVQESTSPVERIQFLIKAVDRRFLALTNANTAKPRESADVIEKWGEFPVGSRAELLSDVAGILNESAEYLNEISSRDPNSKALANATREIVAAAKRWRPKLQAMEKKAKGDEATFLNEALEHIGSIIESEGRLPSQQEMGS